MPTPGTTVGEVPPHVLSDICRLVVERFILPASSVSRGCLILLSRTCCKRCASRSASCSPPRPRIRDFWCLDADGRVAGVISWMVDGVYLRFVAIPKKRKIFRFKAPRSGRRGMRADSNFGFIQTTKEYGGMGGSYVGKTLTRDQFESSQQKSTRMRRTFSSDSLHTPFLTIEPMAKGYLNYVLKYVVPVKIHIPHQRNRSPLNDKRRLIRLTPPTTNYIASCGHAKVSNWQYFNSPHFGFFDLPYHSTAISFDRFK